MSDQTTPESFTHDLHAKAAANGTSFAVEYAKAGQHSTDAPETTRAFWRSDYRRAARLIQSFRHVQGDPYTAKPGTAQGQADVLAMALAAAFQADHGGFDTEKFLAGTQLPPAPQYVLVHDAYNAEALAEAEMAEYGETS